MSPMGSSSGLQAVGGMAPAGDAAMRADVELVAEGSNGIFGSANLTAGTSMLCAPIFLLWNDNLSMTPSSDALSAAAAVNDTFKVQALPW